MILVVEFFCQYIATQKIICDTDHHNTLICIIITSISPNPNGSYYIYGHFVNKDGKYDQICQFFKAQ